MPIFSQNYTQIKNRFDNYLNYHGGLNALVDITPDKIVFYNSKKQAEFTLLKTEWETFNWLLKALPNDTLEKIYWNKYLLHNYPVPTDYRIKKGISDVTIVIDPGHIAGNMDMAYMEQKYLHFSKQNHPSLKQDSVDIAEGKLTFETASILKNMLEEKGAKVILSRKENSTSFGYSYEEWMRQYKKKTLDSLLFIKKNTTQKHKQLMNANPTILYSSFFKDYELQHRAMVINAFAPDLTVIIHYNVDEKNTAWQKPSDKNFCMAFIPGCLIADNLKTIQGKLNLLRLLLCNDLDESEKISGLVVTQLSKQLNIPVANKTDASYLSEHCTSSPTKGVYSRNLALCRLVKTPLVYGECLYQDCENECYALTQNTETFYGIQTNKRVVLAAQSFYNAIMKYYEK
ncbi:MAG: N-acetylmuramoyl-L-alanine amidase [Bacteroidia bacterium]